MNAGGTIGDMISINHRGAILSLFSAVDVLAPVVGPFCWWLYYEFLGMEMDILFPSYFGKIPIEIQPSWSVSKCSFPNFLRLLQSGVISIVAFLFLRETYSPIILEQKAKRLRKLTGNPNLHTQRQNTRPLGSLISRAFLRPIRILILSPIVLGLSVYMSLVYGTHLRFIHYPRSYLPRSIWIRYVELWFDFLGFWRGYGACAFGCGSL